jgi:hypothetical protein
MLPTRGGFDQREELFLVHRVVHFVLVELTRHAHDEPELPGIVILAKHGSNPGVRCIGVKNERAIAVGKREDDVAKEMPLELVKGVLLALPPAPRDVLPGEGGERGRECRELREEVVIEAAKSEERTDVLRVAGCRPIGDRLKLLGHRPNAAAAHDESDKLNLVLRE